MSVVVELNPDVEVALKKKAHAKGSRLDEYVAGVLKAHVDLGPSYEEVMAPLWRDFEESGMTEDELDEFMNEIRDEVWQEKRAKRKG